MRNGSTIYGGTNNGVKYSPLALWGGGFVTGVDIATDGTIVVRTDTAGSWIWDATALQWTKLLRVGDNISLANSKYNYTSANGAENGCYDVAIAATNSSVIYTWEMGYVYVTSNKGVSFTKTSLSQILLLSPNDNSRTCRKKMVVDSAGTAVCVLYDPTATTGGLQYTLNTGTTWTKSASVPAASGTGGCIAYDRDSTVTSSKHQRWGVWVPGNGLYLSTTGPDGTFAKDTGYPGGTTDITSMVMFGNGIIETCDGLNVYRRTAAGVWSTASTNDIFCLAVNYADTTKLLGMSQGGAVMASVDSGVTWTSDPGVGSRVATDAPWLATTNEVSMSTGMLMFNPNVAGQVIFVEGIGAWYTNSISYTQGVKPVWTSMNKGLRGLVVQRMTMTPTGKLLIVSQDRNFAKFARGNVNVSPSQVGIDNVTAILHGTDVDYADDNESNLVVALYGTNPVRLSSNGGDTWTVPAGAGPDGSSALGGNVAINGSSNIVVLPAGNYPPYYTTNGGTSWAYCKFGGVTLPTVNGNGGTANGLKPFNVYSFRRKVLVSDPNNASCFWFYCCGTDDGAGSGPTYNTNYSGVWRSTDGGANFTRVYTGHLDPSFQDFYHSHIVPVYGKPGHLFWYAGDIGVDDVAGSSTYKIQFSSDYGATWTALPGLLECEAMCVGAPAYSGAYPALTGYGYTAASDATARVIARSTDFNSASPTSLTWTTIGSNPYPYGDYCSGVTMAAHPSDTFGFFGMGKAGAGAFYGQYDHTAHGT